jgi:predicted nucleic-acid-binding Zn-ribbon protein
MEKPKRGEKFMPQACPICGGSEFEEGSVGNDIYIPSSARGFIWNPDRTRVVRCLNCDYLMTFVSPRTKR